MSTPIDLSLVPPPASVEVVSFEAIRDEMLQDLDTRMLAVDPDWTPPPASDPSVRVLEVCAYREMLLRQRINDATLAVLFAMSTGADLDQVVAWLGVLREGRTDAEVRAAWFEALHALSTAGPGLAYVALAQAVEGVKGAASDRPVPGTVRVTVLADVDNGTPPPELLEDVAAALSGDDVRPLTDTVEVVGATIATYTVVARLNVPAGPDPQVVVQAARDRVAAYAATRHRLGGVVTRQTLLGAIAPDGSAIDDVDLSSPTSVTLPGPRIAPYCVGIDIELDDS